MNLYSACVELMRPYIDIFCWIVVCVVVIKFVLAVVDILKLDLSHHITKEEDE